SPHAAHSPSRTGRRFAVARSRPDTAYAPPIIDRVLRPGPEAAECEIDRDRPYSRVVDVLMPGHSAAFLPKTSYRTPIVPNDDRKAELVGRPPIRPSDGDSGGSRCMKDLPTGSESDRGRSGRSARPHRSLSPPDGSGHRPRVSSRGD